MVRIAALSALVLVVAASLAGGRVSAASTTFGHSFSRLTMVSSPLARPVPTVAHRVSSWCGTTSATDRPPAVTGYSIRVIYAMPNDGADQSATWAPKISDFLDQITAWWQREDPSHAPRFDLYAAPCGLQPDLQVMRVTAASVGSPDPNQVADQIWNQLQADPAAAYTKFLVFYDDYDTQNLCGLGGPAGNSALGQPSMGVAQVFLAGCNGVDLASVAAHELLHAVNPATGLAGAPHTCTEANDSWHVCDSSGDVLYPYAESGIALTSLQLDVGHDDYWAGTAPVNLQVQPWFRHVQDQAHLGLTVSGSGEVKSDLPGLDCTASCGTDWDRGDAVNLTAAPAAGFRFVRWSGGCTGSAGCAVTLDASKDVTALFAPATFALTVRVTGTGTVSSTPRGLTCRRGSCTKPFASYQAVVLTAKAAADWRFSGWSGACHGKRLTCSVPMSAPAAARAAFAKKR